ncbi:peptide-N(4)-(N-acetyl-beta-glucosaminyl)asparagine amidase [Plodia interpunctella]|uniref:peptide-N(4)-(N-acetyl-beta- glucosaminyl)asparagine amidase n=1 Tax=Plodia interpunctella TaxID=58824 RepID=UPI00236828C2|nr:peptide-N(4)-(N-acetyl-beta-glucosaminyl)asparagine amidase [Plodia interpunctella]
MEDMARLALVEQSVRDTDKFGDILYEVLRHINTILENPHDYELRTIKSDVLKKCLECEALGDYMKYVGFQSVADSMTYPKEYSLSKLRIAQATIERKLCFCYGALDQSKVTVKSFQNTPAKKPKFIPANILKTHSPLLLKIEALFNNMIQYEDDELQELARAHIPIVTLQLMAIDRLREHQKKIKSGEIKSLDLPFDIALLMELLSWFKYKFFSWVDTPACVCGGLTEYSGSTSVNTGTEICTVEKYYCIRCEKTIDFPRYNDPRALLRSRRGRCGEWANCFVLLCRSLGYDTRYVYDITDHVWCEVFDYDSNTWLHVDPCEAKLNAPLLYSHGWGKKLSYVIAVSRDDLQDVTWRYTNNHKEVLTRRNMASEVELIEAILTLREHRQRQVSDARRRYLAKRCLEELIQLMVERKAVDYESHGRISGSKQWRTGRGEMGKLKKYTFHFEQPGRYQIRYFPTRDKYRVSQDGKEIDVIQEFARAAYECKRMMLKVELDWKMVYLARNEDSSEEEGTISWRLSTNDDLKYKQLSVRLKSALYDTGHIKCSLKFDDREEIDAQLNDTLTTFDREFTSVIITAKLSGGSGEIAWQQAQLCRMSVEENNSGLDIQAVLENK